VRPEQAPVPAAQHSTAPASASPPSAAVLVFYSMRLRKNDSRCDENMS
jgi:hypothetical protein